MSLTREEWIKKCAERLQQRGGMDEEVDLMLRLLAIALNMIALYYNRQDTFIDIALILAIIVILISFTQQRSRP